MPGIEVEFWPCLGVQEFMQCVAQAWAGGNRCWDCVDLSLESFSFFSEVASKVIS